jgi:hypothetical protein
MIKYIRDLNQLVNPVKLADDAVFALSSIERGRKPSPELLKKGIELCDYLINLLEELKAPETQGPQSAFRAVRDDDKKALQESGIDIDMVRRVKNWINDLMKDPSSHTSEEIKNIKKFLITMTMPMWQNRTLEFRERKLKRRLIIRG